MAEPVPVEELEVRQRPNDRGGQPPPEGWEERFFVALRLTQLPTEAAKAAGVSRSHVYRQRQRDPKFAERWDEEKERVVEVLESAAVRRAVDGSDPLLMFLLKSYKPEVYREDLRVKHDHNVEGALTLQVDGKQPIQMDAARRREAARLLLEGGKEAAAEYVEGTVTEAEEE